MITYFPKPYPDELLYSTIARFIDHSLTLRRHANIELFNNVAVDLNFLSPTRISKFVSCVSPAIDLSVKSLIYDHTLYPLSANMMSDKKARRLYNSMAGSGKKHLYSSYDIGKQEFKYCPRCVDNDREIFGETYWHRCHNIPEVKTCHVHNLDLLIWTPPIELSGTRQVFAANQVLLEAIKPTFTLSCPSNFEKQLVELTQGRRKIDLEWIRSVGIELGYITLAKNHYTVKSMFLNNLNDYILNQHIEYFYLNEILVDQVKKIIVGKWVATYPVLILILEEFLKSNRAKWGPEVNCINRFCTGYGQPLLKGNWKFLRFGTKKKGLRAYCEVCGMVFSRSLESDQKPFVLDYGVITKGRIYELAASGLSCYKIAHDLKISIRAVKAVLYVKPDNRKKLKRIEVTDELRERMRSAWTTELHSQQFVSIRESSSKMRKVFKWLSQYDGDWLKKINKPLWAEKTYPESRTNFKEVDLIVLQQLQEIHRTICEGMIRRRVTWTFLKSRLRGYRGVPLAQLPLAGRFVDSIVETPMMFLKRQVADFIVKQKSKKELTFYTIRKAIGRSELTDSLESRNMVEKLLLEHAVSN